MEKAYRNIGYYFIAIWLIAMIGFHRTYTVFFPAFSGFRWEHHFHGAMLMAWFALLIVQPFLIRYGNYEWHRTLGKLGYVLAPLVCLSIFEVTRLVYFREIEHRPVQDVLGQLSLDIPTIPTFGLFAGLAFIYRKQTPAHVRYITATSFLMIGPGLGRALIIYGGIPFPIAVTAVLYLTVLLSLILLLVDVVRRQNIYPALIICLLITGNVLCWQFQTSGWWQATAKSVVGLFF